MTSIDAHNIIQTLYRMLADTIRISVVNSTKTEIRISRFPPTKSTRLRLRPMGPPMLVPLEDRTRGLEPLEALSCSTAKSRSARSAGTALGESPRTNSEFRNRAAITGSSQVPGTVRVVRSVLLTLRLGRRVKTIGEMAASDLFF